MNDVLDDTSVTEASCLETGTFVPSQDESCLRVFRLFWDVDTLSVVRNP